LIIPIICASVKRLFLVRLLLLRLGRLYIRLRELPGGQGNLLHGLCRSHLELYRLEMEQFVLTAFLQQYVPHQSPGRPIIDSLFSARSV